MTLKIILYTTPGCFACRVMERIVCQAIEDFENVSFILEKVGTDDKGIKRAKELNLTDFPTTRFINHDTNTIAGELKGTYPVDTVTEIISNLMNV